MRNLTFINKSGITMLVTVGADTYKLSPSQFQSVQLTDDSVVFSLCPDSVNRIKYLLKGAGIISRRHFVVSSEIHTEFDGDCEISLYTQTRKGKFMDEYEFCVPYCTDAMLNNVSYSVRDADSFRKVLEKSNRKSKRALFLFDILDIFGNALVGILILCIPFLLIWFFKDITLAWDICSIAFIPIFIIIVVINRFFDKIKKTAWRKGKSYMLRNQIFKDYNSYFEHDYILSVAKTIK